MKKYTNNYNTSGYGATERNTQSGHEGAQPRILDPSHSRDKPPPPTKSTSSYKTLRDVFRYQEKEPQPSEKKTGKLVFGNLIRKCGLSRSWERSLLPWRASLLESDGEINHWGIGFQSQLGRTGWTPALGNGLGGAALWIGILHCSLKALPACAKGSSWLD